MLNCFSTSRGRSLRTPGRESVSERLRRRLTPSRHRRPPCEHISAVTDTLEEAPPRVATTDEEKSKDPCEVCPNTDGTTKQRIPRQVWRDPETPGSSELVSPGPGTNILGRQRSPGWQIEVAAIRPPDSLTSLVSTRADAAPKGKHLTGSCPELWSQLVCTLPDPVTCGEYLTGSYTEPLPVKSDQAAGAQLLPELFMPVSLGSEPHYSLSLPSTSTTDSSTLQALSMGTTITTPRAGTSISLAGLSDEIGDGCSLNSNQFLTKTWVEEIGDPHTLSPESELEAFPLPEQEEAYELPLCTSLPASERPKVPCVEDPSAHSKAAGLWRKFYCAKGHRFQPKRFCRRALCAVCADSVAGLGRLVYKCMNCKILVHKRCHTLVTTECGQHASPLPPMTPMNKPPTASDPTWTLIPSQPASHCSLEQLTADEEEHDTRESGQAPSRLGPQDFNFLRVLGRGNFAKVFLVQLKNTNRIFAMKVVKKDRSNCGGVETEQRMLQQVWSHPFLVGLHCYFHTESKLFFLLEYGSGGNFLLHMQRHGIVPEPHARFYAAEIGLALNYLHQRGVLYGNMKMQDLLLDSEGHIKLTDYYICKQERGPRDLTSTLCSEVNYLAPETIQGEPYSCGVDWWHLGAILYEMLTGESPFPIMKRSDVPDEKACADALQFIVESAIHVPLYLSVEAASVLEGLLKKDPKQRLGCCGDMGFVDIQLHPFFQNVNWDLMGQKRVVPPFKPRVGRI